MINFLLIALVGLYFFIYVLIHRYIGAPPQSIGPEPTYHPIPIGDLRRDADTYHNKPVIVSGIVVESGNWFYELLFLKTYLLEVDSLETIRIFSKNTLPNEGTTLEVRGIFRQFYHGKFLQNGIGIWDLGRRRISKGGSVI